jgi:hypothetical protein
LNHAKKNSPCWNWNVIIWKLTNQSKNDHVERSFVTSHIEFTIHMFNPRSCYVTSCYLLIISSTFPPTITCSQKKGGGYFLLCVCLFSDHSVLHNTLHTFTTKPRNPKVACNPYLSPTCMMCTNQSAQQRDFWSSLALTITKRSSNHTLTNMITLILKASQILQSSIAMIHIFCLDITLLTTALKLWCSGYTRISCCIKLETLCSIIKMGR